MLFVKIMTLIAGFESFNGVPYADRAQNTHGYGTKSTSAQCITHEQALNELYAQVAKHFEPIAKNKRLTDKQVMALTSFSYNVGSSAYKNSKVAKLVKQGNICSAAKELKSWIHQSGKVLPGLEVRRAKEAKLLTEGKC